MVAMGFEYTVLPDGSIFKLDGPEDFILAREIYHDEVGDLGVFHNMDAIGGSYPCSYPDPTFDAVAATTCPNA